MANEKKASVFEVLNAVNCNEHTEKKNGLTYLSWAWAWAEVKKKFPSAAYTVYENASGWNYFTDGNTCWVKTGVTIDGLEHIEYLPVMDFRNQSIPAAKVTSFDVNKAIQRSLTKACARHGLGLYIYAGEDLPEDADQQSAKPVEALKQAVAGKAEPAKDDALATALKEIAGSTTSTNVKALWTKYPALQKNKEFYDAIKARGQELVAQEDAAKKGAQQ